MDPKQSRGYRNKNPGNIDWSPKNNWQGQTGKETTGSPPRFAVFSSHEHGVRALVALLTTYQTRHRLHNIEQIISRWAPGNENDTEAYIKHVAQLTGFDRKARLDMRLYDHARPVVEAVIIHELGGNPYAGTTVIEDGLELYGVVQGVGAPVTTAAQAATTGTGHGVIVGTAATGMVAVAVQSVPAVTALNGLDWRVGVALVLLAGFGVVAFVLTRRKQAA